MRPQPTRLRRATPPRSCPTPPPAPPSGTRRPLLGRRRRRLRLGRRLLQDHVRVRAADAERGHPRATRPVADAGHCSASVSSSTSPAVPVDVRRRRIDVQRARQHAVPHRLHHLDHTGHTRRRRRVPDVRLDRPEPQRTVHPLPPVGGQQRLRLDRVTQPRPRPVALDRIDVGRRSARRSPAPDGSPAPATGRSAPSGRCSHRPD